MRPRPLVGVDERQRGRCHLPCHRGAGRTQAPRRRRQARQADARRHYRRLGVRRFAGVPGVGADHRPDVCRAGSPWTPPDGTRHGPRRSRGRWPSGNATPRAADASCRRVWLRTKRGRCWSTPSTRAAARRQASSTPTGSSTSRRGRTTGRGESYRRDAVGTESSLRRRLRLHRTTRCSRACRHDWPAAVSPAWIYERLAASTTACPPPRRCSPAADDHDAADIGGWEREWGLVVGPDTDVSDLGDLVDGDYRFVNRDSASGLRGASTTRSTPSARTGASAARRSSKPSEATASDIPRSPFDRQAAVRCGARASRYSGEMTSCPPTGTRQVRDSRPGRREKPASGVRAFDDLDSLADGRAGWNRAASPERGDFSREYAPFCKGP